MMTTMMVVMLTGWLAQSSIDDGWDERATAILIPKDEFVIEPVDVDGAGGMLDRQADKRANSADARAM